MSKWLKKFASSETDKTDKILAAETGEDVLSVLAPSTLPVFESDCESDLLSAAENYTDKTDENAETVLSVLSPDSINTIFNSYIYTENIRGVDASEDDAVKTGYLPTDKTDEIPEDKQPIEWWLRQVKLCETRKAVFSLLDRFRPLPWSDFDRAQMSRAYIVRLNHIPAERTN